MKSAFSIYKDKRGEFRWNFRAGNREIMADSGEGYKSAAACRDALKRFLELAAETDPPDLPTVGPQS